ncbi:MAG TPA: hypothetical protein VFV36_08755, partial [Candidatus Methylomirabilis sp.]|nr:hypothetical protein [Candidatus Methylomirabilis sp.]
MRGAGRTITLRLRVLSLLVSFAVTGVASTQVAGAAERVFVQHLVSEPVSLDPAKSNRIQDDRVMWL